MSLSLIMTTSSGDDGKCFRRLRASGLGVGALLGAGNPQGRVQVPVSSLTSEKYEKLSRFAKHLRTVCLLRSGCLS